MNNDKNNDELTDEIVDTDLIDLDESDEVIGDDVLEEETPENIDNAEGTDEIIASDPDDVDLADKTVGDALDQSENTSDAFKPDPDVDAAVDDIVRTESDEIIAEADAKMTALQEKKAKLTFKKRISNGLHGWWDNQPVRYGTFAALILLFATLSLLPASRYTVLNALGVRVNSSMTVLDSQTKLPLKNINVQLQEQSGKTDDKGEISFSELKLGNSKLIISQRGYADINTEIVLGLGSNPLGEQFFVATGEQFTFVLSDWKSNEPITEAEATSGVNSARADETGKIVLTIGEDNINDVEVTITAQNYRNEVFSSEELGSDNVEVKLVPSKKHSFISNRNGNYDLYTIDVDAQNEKILLEATGKEREVPIVTPHPSKDVIAFASSRDGDENTAGFVLDGLFIVDTKSGEQKRIARSEQLQVIGWSGDRLIFLQVVEGTSSGNDQRSKLISYNLETGERLDLAAANYFNDVELVGEIVYYAVSSFAVPESQAKLYTVNVDGKNNSKLIDYQVWNIFRAAHNTLLFSAVDQKWFQQVDRAPVEEIAKQVAPTSYNFVDSPNGKRTVWVEIRDGKGVMLKSSTGELIEEQALSLPGLFDVLYWVNNSTLVFRVINTGETADYVLNLDGGEMQKITDVTATRNSYF